MAAGVPLAVGSDVGPFPHGTQAREYVLMGSTAWPRRTLRAGLINGARLLGLGGPSAQLKPGFLADVIAVQGNPLEDIKALKSPSFVMKNGEVIRK